MDVLTEYASSDITERRLGVVTVERLSGGLPENTEFSETSRLPNLAFARDDPG